MLGGLAKVPIVDWFSVKFGLSRPGCKVEAVNDFLQVRLLTAVSATISLVPSFILV